MLRKFSKKSEITPPPPPPPPPPYYYDPESTYILENEYILSEFTFYEN